MNHLENNTTIMKIKYLLVFCTLFFTGNKSDAQNFLPNDKLTSIQFLIKNFGIGVDGSFKNAVGKIVFDSTNLKNANFNISVDAGTINTDNSTRDKHLRKEEYFDVEKFPKISFQSEKVEKGILPSTYMVTGKFFLKGKSKMVTIPFSAIAQGSGFLFQGKIGLNRRDFSVGGSSFILSDNLLLTIKLVAVKSN